MKGGVIVWPLISFDVIFSRYMFCTARGAPSKIERAEMDSSNRRVIIRKNIHWPNGLTIDYSAQKIYWTDFGLQYIAKANYDGSNRESIFRSSTQCLLGSPVALTMYENKIYWADWETKTIRFTNKSNGLWCPAILSHTGWLIDIRAYEPKRQMPRPRPGEFNFKYCCLAHLVSLRLHVDHYVESCVPYDQFITFTSFMCLVAHNPCKNLSVIAARFK